MESWAQKWPPPRPPPPVKTLAFPSLPGGSCFSKEGERRGDSQLILEPPQHFAEHPVFVLGCFGEDGWPNFRSAGQPHPLKVTSSIPGIPTAEVSSSWKDALQPSRTWGYTLTHDIHDHSSHRENVTLSLPHLAGGKRAVSFISRDSVHLVSSSQVIAITVLGQIKVVSSENSSSRKSLPHSTRACQLYLITWSFSVLLSLGLAVAQPRNRTGASPTLLLFFSP